MKVLELSPRLTVRGGVRRKLFAIRCCGHPMHRTDAFSVVAFEDEDKPNYSIWKMKCSRCGHELELDLEMGNNGEKGAVVEQVDRMYFRDAVNYGKNSINKLPEEE